MKGYLVLENGQVFEGEKIGAFKKTALELVLAAAEENKVKAEAINPKIISVHRADEEPIEIKQAVGQNNIVKIDKAKMIRNLEKRQEE